MLPRIDDAVPRQVQHLQATEVREILNDFDGVASKIQSDEIDVTLQSFDMSNFPSGWCRRLRQSDSSREIERVDRVGMRWTKRLVVGRF